MTNQTHNAYSPSNTPKIGAVVRAVSMLTPFIITDGPYKGQIEYGTDAADAADEAGAPVRALTAAEAAAEAAETLAEMRAESGFDYGDENGSGTEMMNDLRCHRMYDE